MITNSKKQTGGTLLGLIIGLIVGLGIAVGVALVITKSSLPFTSKPVNADRAPLPAAGDLTDPNKPLYGKKQPVAPSDAPAPVMPATTETSPPAPMPAPTVVEQSIKPPVVDHSTPPKSTTPEKVNGAKADTANADSAGDKWIYYLQAGAFREMADAETMRAKLALQGFEASISERQADTGSLYRVRVGPFNQLDAMNRVRGKLSDNGIDVAVVRIGK